ncbi:proteasome beta subunit C1 [Actinidia rufa]|uniref:ACT domain-containing protein ACR n=1 Tax=Actinidia rufa TaxID=165716 RepID=A0A7J0EG32_9ERIC|nr:proteasome beta subunit C1 [Actinidia rufa]
MVGKNCFAIASDRRLGVQLQTIATDFQRIYKIHDKLFIGLAGLATDAQTLYQKLVFRHKLYQLREERDMKPQTFASLVSALLYEKRFGPFFCQPVIAGLGDEDKPFICTMDSIGAKELAKDFVVAGTASESLYGACEAMFKPDMEAEELFETISQALLSSVDRDCLSGWGGHVYVVRIACVLYVNDDTTCRAVDNPTRLSAMEEQLKNILRGCEDDEKAASTTSFSIGSTHVDRRLHQMLFADRDYEDGSLPTETDYHPSFKPKIMVDRCEEKGYSVVSVKCKDRAKLMFDIVCTLTDMQYVVFHASISSEGPYASQEYYIRHMDGCTLDTEGERERVVKCLEAAIRRRISEGLSLELCAKDRVGLLSEVTRVLRENGLSVTRAGVTTVGELAVIVFYVSDASGNPVDTKTIETLRKEIGQTMMLNVKKVPVSSAKAPEA